MPSKPSQHDNFDHLTDAELNTLHEQLQQRLSTLRPKTSKEYSAVSLQFVTVIREQARRTRQRERRLRVQDE
jgi:hypothetical protein